MSNRPAAAAAGFPAGMPGTPLPRLLAVSGLAIAIGAATVIEPRIAIALCAITLVPILVWTDPRLGFALFAFSLAINVDVLGGPIHVSLPQLIALAVLAGALLRASPRAAAGRSGLWAAGGGVFVLATLPSLIRAVEPGAAMVGILELVILSTVLAVTVRWMVRRPDTVEPVLAMLVAGAALTLVPALLQVVFGIGRDAFRAGGIMRAYAWFSEPNTYGLYLAGIVPIALVLATRRSSLAYAAAATAILLALGLTGSRGAWVGTLAGLLALALVAFRWRTRTLIAGVACIAGIAAIGWFLPPELIVARLALDDWSTQQRLLVLLSTFDGIERSPILGHGAGSFAAMLSSLARAGLVDDVTMPHNLLLDVWFQFGILPLLCLLGFAIAYAFVTGRAARRTGDLRIAGLFAGVAAMFVASMFGTLFIRGVQETFVLLIALSAALVRVPSPGASNAPEKTDA
ncbi:MAG: O-antigen ligase family protein [Longimicrobiales bacterium]